MLNQSGGDVTGTYGKAGEFSIKGTVKARKLTFEYQEGQVKGAGTWTLDKSGHAFTGSHKVRNGRAGEWNGWRPDTDAPKGKPASLGGLWLTDLGLMALEQAGDRANGQFALGGVSNIEGTVTGRRFELKYTAFRGGDGWFDVAADGKSFAGAAGTDGFPNWFAWRGRRAPEFVRHATLVRGKIIDGSTRGLLTYSVRAPEGYKAGDGRTWPAVVILHGSNMNGKAYLGTIAGAWPDIAKDYLLIGINGERPSDLGGPGTDPKFNYTYVDYVGRSAYKGFPGTDRQSPALVAQALADLREAYPIARYFVGGHSQGGFLTYSLLMNFPELIAGAFPVSAGVIFQCEPSAYADTEDKLRAAQRSVPLAVVHGRQDQLVGFGMGEHAATLFGEAGWPAFRFFADTSGAGHRFALLPVDDAIRWLEAQASDDPAQLLDFAEKRLKTKGYRDAIAALNRAGGLQPDDAAKARLDRLSSDVDAKAAAGAKKFLPQIRAAAAAATGKPWIDAFLTWRDDFEFAPAARETMEAFNALRAQHDGPAKKLVNEARAAFQQGRRDEGYAKYQEVVDKHYGAASYRNVKRWLAERK